ncbi:MAG: LacI family DNA-binding transcriptional regulator [Actinomycetaceae bacterium]|nr:LacI family DNA-binding transcriptional regulator [Actinomycetaceae bacterium]
MSVKTKRVTLEDVAARARVSRATASRVIRGDQRVSPKKVKAVKSAVAELGYRPNSAARALVTNRSGVTAVVIPEPDSRVFSDPFFARSVQSLSSELGKVGSQAVLVFFSTKEQSERTESFLSSGAVDGAIVLSHHRYTGEIERLLKASVPTVFIGRIEEDTSAWVDSNNYAGGQLAARHLLNQGCARPAVVAGPADMIAGKDRLQGFLNELESENIDSIVEPGAFTYASGYEAGKRLVSRLEVGEVDGIFSSSDLMAQGIFDAFKEAGAALGPIPIVSFDNSPIAEELSLSSITNSTDQLAYEATKLLESRLTGTWNGEPVVLPINLVERTPRFSF